MQRILSLLTPERAKNLAADCLVLGGFAAIAQAAWWLHPSAGLALTGVAAVWSGILLARNGRK